MVTARHDWPSLVTGAYGSTDFVSMSLNGLRRIEFGLIVAALGVSQAWLSVDWLVVVAVAVSVSFAMASPFSFGSENAHQQFKMFWDRFQQDPLHAQDQILNTGDARVLVIGMGRVGSGAYDELSLVWPGMLYRPWQPVHPDRQGRKPCCLLVQDLMWLFKRVGLSWGCLGPGPVCRVGCGFDQPKNWRWLGAWRV